MIEQATPHAEFSRVIACTLCSSATDRHFLRDDAENIPQPGYVGRNYAANRVLLVGQNPGTPKSLADEDRPYTAALRELRDRPSPERYASLKSVLDEFIPRWPVRGSYFPLEECGLTLDDIAYCNVVRCRTSGDKQPGRSTVSQCRSAHFGRWLQWLGPRVVVFIGKWAAANASSAVIEAGIPFSFMNRHRSLSSAERAENRADVVKLVRSVLANGSLQPTATGHS